MNTSELIYKEVRDLPETKAREVLDFIEFLKSKLQRVLKNAQPTSENNEQDMNELDQFGSVYDGHFDRDACYDRSILR